MTGRSRLRGAAWAALLLLVACDDGAQGDWRAAFGRPTPNPLVVTPAPPLVIPPTLALPPPAGAAAAAPGG